MVGRLENQNVISRLRYLIKGINHFYMKHI